MPVRCSDLPVVAQLRTRLNFLIYPLRVVLCYVACSRVCRFSITKLSQIVPRTFTPVFLLCGFADSCQTTMHSVPLFVLLLLSICCLLFIVVVFAGSLDRHRAAVLLVVRAVVAPRFGGWCVSFCLLLFLLFVLCFCLLFNTCVFVCVNRRRVFGHTLFHIQLCVKLSIQFNNTRTTTNNNKRLCKSLSVLCSSVFGISK